MSGDFFNSTHLIKSKSQSELFLIFDFLDKIYAIPAERVAEIIQLPALTVIKKAPDHVIGLLNLRGEVISVIDPATFLGVEQQSYTVDHQVLIINDKNKRIGIIIHSVSDVVQLDKNMVEPLPYNPNEKIVSGIYKHKSHIVALIDINSMLESIETVEEKYAGTPDNLDFISNHFPVDEESKIKFLQRAEKLQISHTGMENELNYQENYFISCCLNKEIYCINLRYVKEITKLSLVNFSPVPCVPEFIAGIVNLRGEFITLVDIKHFLNVPKTSISEKTKIIVIKMSDMQIGLLVDDIFNIENISTDKMNLNVQSKYEKNSFTSAEVLLPNNQIMSVFDTRKFFEDERLFIEDSV